MRYKGVSWRPTDSIVIICNSESYAYLHSFWYISNELLVVEATVLCTEIWNVVKCCDAILKFEIFPHFLPHEIRTIMILHESSNECLVTIVQLSQKWYTCNGNYSSMSRCGFQIPFRVGRVNNITVYGLPFTRILAVKFGSVEIIL